MLMMKIPKTKDILINAVFANIKNTLKRDLKKWEKQHNQRKLAGKRSAEVRKQNATLVNARSISSTVSVSVNVSDINNIHDLFVDEVKKGGFDSRIEAIYMRLRLREGCLTPLLIDYKLHIIEENRLHKNIEEYFTNFRNWLNLQDRIGKLNKHKR